MLSLVENKFIISLPLSIPLVSFTSSISKVAFLCTTSLFSSGCESGSTAIQFMMSNVSTNNSPSGYKLLNVNTIEFAIPSDYVFVDYLSGGNYGNVVKVMHVESKAMFAVSI
jgi:hypothetical protein